MDDAAAIRYTPAGTPVWPMRGGDGTDDDSGAPGGDEGNEPPPATTLLPEAIRNSPEYRALAKQNRTLARELGTATAQAAAARGEAETTRQAAEADRAAALEQQIVGILGEDGVAAFNELSELSATDPVAAATRMAQLIEARAQTPGTGEPAAGQPPVTPPANGSATVPARTPPPPSGRVDGNVPLGAAMTTDDTDAIIASGTATFDEVVKRNNDPAAHNRVTMKDRAKGMMAFLAVDYLKQGAVHTPKPERRA